MKSSRPSRLPSPLFVSTMSTTPTSYSISPLAYTKIIVHAAKVSGPKNPSASLLAAVTTSSSPPSSSFPPLFAPSLVPFFSRQRSLDRISIRLYRLGRRCDPSSPSLDFALAFDGDRTRARQSSLPPFSHLHPLHTPSSIPLTLRISTTTSS